MAFDQKSKFSRTAFRDPKGVIKNICNGSNLFRNRQERVFFDILDPILRLKIMVDSTTQRM